MRNIILTIAAIALLIAIFAVPAIQAQQPAKPAASSATVKGANAKAAAPALPDAKTLVHDVGVAHGMLRTLQENDATTTAQFQATGTQYIVGQAFRPGGPWPAAKLTKYNVWINYAVPGMRIDLERTNPDGQISQIQGGGGLPFAAPQRQILVVGANRAWNETMLPGGPATPAIGQQNDRLVQIWMLPQGAVKAARRAGDKVVVGKDGDKLTLTFPLPDPIANYIETVRLDARKLIEHVEVMVDNPVLGDTKLEVDYDNYKDPDLSDIPFPFHIVQKLGGLPLLDVTVKNARMYNPYVVVPIPDNVEKAYAANAPDPQAMVTVQKAGTGIYFLTGASHNSLAVEFKDYIAVVESPLGDNRAMPMFDAVRKQFPNKKIRYVINTHHHFDHAGGLRDAVAEGATIVTYQANKPYYEKVLLNKHTIVPDHLQKSTPAKKPSIEAMTDKRVFTDGTQTMELYKVQGSNHADTMLVVYFPKDKLLVEADLWNPPAQANAPALTGIPALEPTILMSNIQRLKLDVSQIAPIHGRIVPFSEFRRSLGQADTTN